jgi:hypothetical protein
MKTNVRVDFSIDQPFSSTKIKFYFTNKAYLSVRMHNLFLKSN